MVFSHSKHKSTRSQAARRARPTIEQLESRLVPYSVSGNVWPNAGLVTLGFVPDGTVVGSNGQGHLSSNLQGTFNTRFGSAAAWQRQVLRAAQVWAEQTNLNIAVVGDNGVQIGTGNYQQGDPAMADIRVGGYNFGTTTLAQAFMPPPINNYSIAGDFQFNTSTTAGIGTTRDLFTVSTHEVGHVLGLYHSGIVSAAMYGSYSGIKPALNADDIAGIRAIYGGARSKDAYDAAASNDTFATATNLTSLINLTSKTALATGLDLTTSADKDFYKFTVPTGLGGTLSLKLQSSGLSLLSPKVTVYASNQTTVLGSATAAGDYDGATLTVNWNATVGQTYYVKVEGAETQTGSWQAFNTGRYALALGLAGVTAPAVPLLNTQVLKGAIPSAGGGQATKVTDEFRVNTSTANTQETGAETRQAVAMDASGNYVVAWSSKDQDGSGWGVYAQRYNSTGTPLGSEFRVNTTTAGDQKSPAVAMSDSGNFVVAWASDGQDGSGWGTYAQRYNAAGVKQGSEFRVNTTTANDQKQPVLAVDSAGRLVVAWQDSGKDGSGSGIYARRYDASGVAQGSEFRVNTTTAGDQVHPAVALDDSGNFVITWSSDGQDGSGWGIYAQRYNWQGQAQGSEFRVNTYTSDYQHHSSVAVAPGGEFVVTWSSKNQDGEGWGVYARRYNDSGVAQGSEFRVNTRTADDQKDASIAMDNDGNFLITWSSKNQDGDGWGIYGQQYTADGAIQGGELCINTTTSLDQEASSVAIASSGDAVVVWSGNGPGDDRGIFAQMYDVNGSSGMSSNLKAGEPHGYGEDGCGCGQAHHDDRHDDSSGCGCPACMPPLRCAPRPLLAMPPCSSTW